MTRALDSTMPMRHTSMAAATRVAPLSAEDIIPPRWPFVVSCVALLGLASGILVSQARAPVGNLVVLSVTALDGALPPDVLEGLRASTQAELTRQLRALKLEVDAPLEGRDAATHVHVTVSGHADPDVQPGVSARALVQVDVTDDDAGGMSSAAAGGFGATARLSAEAAGTHLAWLVTTDVARLVAPGTNRQSMLRRVTDGRGSLRVFARAAATLHDERDARLASQWETARAHDATVTTLTRPRDHVQLMCALTDTTAIMARTARTAVVLPTARQAPRVLESPDAVFLWTPAGEIPLFRVWRVVAGGRVGEDGWVVSQAPDGVLRGDVVTAQGEVRALPYDEAELLRVAADARFRNGALQVRRCLSGCAWEPSTADAEWDAHTLWPPETTFAHALADGTRLALAPTGGPLSRIRLQVRRPGEWTFHPLLPGATEEGNPQLTPDGRSLLLEAHVPDPDLHVTWRQVRRITLETAPPPAPPSP